MRGGGSGVPQMCVFGNYQILFIGEKKEDPPDYWRIIRKIIFLENKKKESCSLLEINMRILFIGD